MSKKIYIFHCIPERKVIIDGWQIICDWLYHDWCNYLWLLVTHHQSVRLHHLLNIWEHRSGIAPKDQCQCTNSKFDSTVRKLFRKSWMNFERSLGPLNRFHFLQSHSNSFNVYRKTQFIWLATNQRTTRTALAIANNF